VTSGTPVVVVVEGAVVPVVATVEVEAEGGAVVLVRVGAVVAS
jgi:hypothetical protein